MRRSRVYLVEREKKMVEYINQVGTVSIEDVCNRFHISASTARAQLNVLQSKGLIVRTHGGAERISEEPAAEPVPPMLCTAKHSISNMAEKTAIAKAACKLVQDNDIIGLCGGSTTYLFSKMLHDFSSLTVVTNSVWAADELTLSPHINLRVCGGIVNHAKGSLNGYNAVEFFSNIRVDKAVIGADTIALDYGATSGDSLMSHLEHLVLTRAREVIILCDHTKFNKAVSIDAVASFEEIDYVVTDSLVDPSVVKLLGDAGVKVIIGEE